MYKKNFKNQKILIIGSGSIAVKHAKILNNLNFKLDILSKRKELTKVFGNIKNIKFISNFKNITNKNYKFCIIANETYKHFEYLKKLINLNFNIYCEKPIAIKKNHLELLKKYSHRKKFKFTCGYQLLSSDIIKKLKKLIIQSNITSVNVYVGHNIKYWRKNSRNKSYFFDKDLGGGAIYELIHEISLINNLFGKITSMKTFTNVSKKYNCHDIAVSIFKTKRNIIGTLNQEIINENFRRYINILTDKDEIIVDIFKGTISKYRKNKIVYFKKFKNNTQESMIKANLVKFIKILNNKHYNNYDLSSSIYDAELAIKMHNDQ